MFEHIAEDIVFLLTRKKLLDTEDREVYVYAIEVLLLNFSLLLTIFVISLLFNQMTHFWCYVLFFIPLRVFLGGYHAKKSETCFLLSVAVYIITIMVHEYFLSLINSELILFFAVVMILVILYFSSEENPDHPLSPEQLRRNKMIVRIIVLFDFTLLIFLLLNQISIASREIVFLDLNGIILLVGKVNNAVVKTKHVSGT